MNYIVLVKERVLHYSNIDLDSICTQHPNSIIIETLLRINDFTPTHINLFGNRYCNEF